MLWKLHKKKTDNLYIENKLLKFAVLVIGGVTVFNSVMLVESSKLQRTIIIPPVPIHEKLELTSMAISGSYKRLIGDYVATKMFNYTPATVKDNFNAVLVMVHPQNFKGMREMLMKQAEVIIREKMVSTFHLASIKEVERKREFIIEGNQRIGSSGSGELRKYAVSYHVFNGRLLITGIRDVK